MSFQPRRRPQLVAHKGNGGAHPANTARAVRSAVELDVDMVEVDISATADGVAVVIHGPELDPSTTGTGAVAETPWKVLAELLALGPDGSASGEPVPRFADLFAEFAATTRWNLDLKTDDVIDEVLSLLEAHDAFDRVVLSGSGPGRVRQVLARSDRVTVLLDLGWFDKTLAGMRWFGPRWVMLRHGRLLAHPQVLALNLRHPSIGPAIVDRAHAIGTQVWAYTVDDQDRVDELVAMGVDSITTNHPADIALR